MECSVTKLARYIKFYNIENFLPQINGYIKALSLNGKQSFDAVHLSKLMPEIQPEVMATLIGLFSDMDLMQVCRPNLVVKNIKEWIV